MGNILLYPSCHGNQQSCIIVPYHHLLYCTILVGIATQISVALLPRQPQDNNLVAIATKKSMDFLIDSPRKLKRH